MPKFDMTEAEYRQLQQELQPSPVNLRQAAQQFVDYAADIQKRAERCVAANQRVIDTPYDATTLEESLREGYYAEVELKEAIAEMARMTTLQLIGFAVACGARLPDEVFEAVGTTRAEVEASQPSRGARPVQPTRHVTIVRGPNDGTLN